MAKHGKIQRVMMRVLAAMMAASLLLAIVSFVLPMPVAAGCPFSYWENYYWPCGSCGANFRYFERYWCQWDPCGGWGPYCYLREWGCTSC